METRYHHTMLGWNARLDAIHAAMLRVKLPYTAQDIQTRRAAASRYDQMIAKRGLDGLMEPQSECASSPHTYNVYTVKVASDQRDGLISHLKTNGIGCEVYYPRPLHLQECLAHLGHVQGDFPISEQMSERVLALPMFPEITPEQQDRVINACARFLRQPARLAA
jgi:dTDP-4-amino-4,6-dideoxygalactose transaminase